MFTTKAYFEIVQYLEKKEIQAALAEIQKRFQLEKLGVDLDFIVELLQLGEIDRTDLADILSDAWKVDFAKALDIAKELSLKVFLPIDDPLKQQRKDFLQRVKDEPGFKPLLVRIFEDAKKREEEAKGKEEQKADETVLAGSMEKTPSAQRQKTTKDIVAIIQRECGLSFQDEHLAKRFESIVTSRFKEIRDEATVKDLFMRSTKVGGLSLEEEVVEKVLMLIAELRREFQEAITDKGEVKGGVIPPLRGVRGVSFTAPSVVAPTLTYRTKTKAQSAGEQGEKKSDDALAKQFQTWKEGKFPPLKGGQGGVLISSFQPDTPSIPTVIRRGKALFEGEKSPLQAPEEEQATLINKRLVRMSDKKDQDKAEEKKAKSLEIFKKEVAKQAKPQEEEEYVSKLIDPLRELEMLAIEDFRRLSQNPEEACHIIEEKIALLGKERSLKGRIDGIKAWQKSALHSEYIELGKERIVTGKSIEDITKEREENQQATLSAGEFHAIMELNKKLRF